MKFIGENWHFHWKSMKLSHFDIESQPSHSTKANLDQVNSVCKQRCSCFQGQCFAGHTRGFM
jgi:hypothetical protein